MADSSTSAPPPYTTRTPSSETSISPASPITMVSGSNLDGIRASILDNAPFLFLLGHHGKKTVPEGFRIVTVKAPPSATSCAPDCIHACVMFYQTVYKGRQEAKLFVQGPQRDTMEAALQALLQKTQEMLGRRWQLPLSCPSTSAGLVYLES